jgi:hypothetical protein
MIRAPSTDTESRAAHDAAARTLTRRVAREANVRVSEDATVPPLTVTGAASAGEQRSAPSTAQSSTMRVAPRSIGARNDCT